MSEPPAPIRVAIADDHPLVREGIRQVLTADPEIAVVGEAGDGPSALRLIEELLPDVAVLDISMPGMSGIDVAARLRETCPRARILILSVHDHPQYARESARSGAQGYLRKDTDPATLRLAIRTIARGGEFFGDLPWSADQPESQIAQGAERRLNLLTRRERQVLEGIAAGETNREIASHLGLSHRTVEAYRESLMKKLEIYTVAGLTRLAVQLPPK